MWIFYLKRLGGSVLDEGKKEERTMIDTIYMTVIFAIFALGVYKFFDFLVEWAQTNFCTAVGG